MVKKGMYIALNNINKTSYTVQFNELNYKVATHENGRT
jgi:hypothetical protein